MQKITPYLWSDGKAEETANFYVSLFKNSKILTTSYYGDEMPEMSGKVLVVEFELEGQKFAVLNGGPEFKFNQAVSFLVDCKDQEEVDYFWDKLSEGGEIIECGWLKDKYGLAWQIIPTVLGEFLADPDKERAGRVMKAMLQMKKIEIEKLKQAYELK